jgi:hypothetical protein
MTNNQKDKTETPATMREIYEIAAQVKKKYADLNMTIPQRMNRRERRKMKTIMRRGR